MSDYTSLRPPLSPSASGINRSSSPVGAHKPHTNQGAGANRYSLGKGSTPTENMMRLAQQQQQHSGDSKVLRSPSMGNNAQISGTPGTGRNLRPSSEMLNMAHQGTPESDAIDKWFEDLQHYEATLEEMAAASLDQNFKEELSAIEQWFRVLSEAERTAALYSLLQESTQVQIRFFITVLQQMARSDPMSALLSPSNPNSSMAEQMEAKLASLGLKSPSAMRSPASPGGRHFHRQSSDAAGFLSPNTAAMYSPGGSDAASALAAQRAKLKANRTSAPGTLIGESRNFSGGSLDNVQERGSSPNPPPRALSGDQSRPKSTDLSNMAGRSPRSTGPLDDTLSPISAGGNWSSMVNTPLVPMFDDKQAAGGGGDANVNLSDAAAQLASLSQQQQQQQQHSQRVMVDPDATKFRRKSQNGNYTQQSQQQQPGGIQGVLSGMYDGTPSSAGVSPSNLAHAGWANQSDFSRSPMSAQSATFGSGFNMANIGTMSPNALAGLQSPTGGMANPLNMQMMNAMAAMGTMNLQNMNAAQFLAMQQQILQNQQSIAAFSQQQQQHMQHMQQPGSGGPRSSGARFNSNQALSPGINHPQSAGRRSPRSATSPSGRSPMTANSGSGGGGGGASGGGGGGDDEVADLATLNDIPQWLRQLRLHKYTPNFENSTWKEMVMMDEKALEAKGVAALGARRKMLKTFEAVREKYGIKMPGGGSEGGEKEEEKGKENGGEEEKAKAADEAATTTANRVDRPNGEGDKEEEEGKGSKEDNDAASETEVDRGV
ncbi:hypothetical protein IE53DRAFT_388366 [Violaceomyces palustris]|uniref:Uncharacterized protein n=1 Tax=Violaceomyces palustris TaxID=1673888 RepID=A0ACD0NUJ4_9BASI|nr:hypothetical protein IE53DRAFT_388366 [Violaceomyces palustris]